MAGKSFKGNLEVLNLSDIFQSLAMNRHSGTLIVNDGKREKKIFFAEGEITLLSTSKRQRLGDLLIASKKISDEDLDLALKLQKQSRKKLGEILVEEGFCEEADIAKLLRQQVEDELYDLFLWRKAEFEFLADQMPDDMVAESPNLTRLSINTNSLIMEALRRLDEWTLIQNLVPSTKEVFIVVASDSFGSTEVPDRIKEQPDLIDAKTNVEALAEKYLMSEFELCQHLAELVKAGAIQALSEEQLAERAEAAYALNDFAGAASLYGRLLEYFPDEPKIMVPLADSMRRSGAEGSALALYLDLSSRLEKEGKDPDRLRQCYEAITQLDPTRHDLAHKLENLELEQAAAPGAKSIVVPLVAVLLLVAVGGVGFVFREQLFSNPINANAGSEAADLLEQAKRAQVAGEFAKMHGHMVEIWQKHPASKEYGKVSLPIQVTTIPPNYDIYVNGIYQGLTTVKESTLTCYYSPSTSVKVEVYNPEGKTNNERPLNIEEFKSDAFQTSTVVLYKRPGGSIIGDAWMQAGVAYLESIKAYVAPSRDGTLRVLQVGEEGMKAVSDWDKKIRIGEYGDLFCAPVVLGDRAFIGTIEQGVLAVTAAGGSLPAEPAALYPAPSRVVAQPTVLPAQAPLDQGRVIFGTETGQVYAYTLDGGKPVWVAKAEAATIGPGLVISGTVLNGGSGGGCLFSSADARVYAFSLLDGKQAWTYVSDVALTGPPTELRGEVVVPRADGSVAGLDPASGAFKRVVYADPTGAALDLVASGETLFVSTSKGQVLALKDGKPVWAKPFERQGTAHAPKIAAQGDVLLVAMDSFHVFGLAGDSGKIIWQAEFPEKNGRTLSPISVTGDGFFVGTNKRFLHYFKR